MHNSQIFAPLKDFAEMTEEIFLAVSELEEISFRLNENGGLIIAKKINEPIDLIRKDMIKELVGLTFLESKVADFTSDGVHFINPIHQEVLLNTKFKKGNILKQLMFKYQHVIHKAVNAINLSDDHKKPMMR